MLTNLLPPPDTIRDALLTRFNAMFIGIIFVFGAVIYAMTQALDAPAYFTVVFYSLPLQAATAFFLFCFVIYRTLYIMIMVRPARLARTIIDDLRGYFTWKRFLIALPVLILTPIFFSLFTTAKNMIPLINPFSWDMVLAEWDRLIHFGKHPWEWLQPALGVTIITLSISFFYKIWFLIKFSVMYWQAFSLKNLVWREELFIALLLIWIINGVILATWLSSAGPCYYGLVLPEAPNPYAALMAYLYDVQIFDLLAQEFLWKAYIGEMPLPFSGISAAPSMHVSLACLYALVGWRYGGMVRWGFFAFLVLTLIGSVHLGWHYAIDGYISLLTTPIIWWATIRFVRFYRREKNHELQDLQASA